jgi:hypothetical protein
LSSTSTDGSEKYDLNEILNPGASADLEKKEFVKGVPLSDLEWNDEGLRIAVGGTSEPRMLNVVKYFWRW